MGAAGAALGMRVVVPFSRILVPTRAGFKAQQRYQTGFNSPPKPHASTGCRKRQTRFCSGRMRAVVAPPSSIESPPQRFPRRYGDRYVLLRPLGEGGMGEVFMAV